MNTNDGEVPKRAAATSDGWEPSWDGTPHGASVPGGEISAALPVSDGRGFTQEVTFQRKGWIVSVMQPGNRILKA